MADRINLLKKLIEETKNMSQEEFDRLDSKVDYETIFSNMYGYEYDGVVFGVTDIEDDL